MTAPVVVDVSSRDGGQKLYQFIEKYVNKQVPRSAIMKWIRTGQVRVDGKRAKPFQRIKQGQQIRIPPYRVEGDSPLIEGRDHSSNPFLLRIVYEDPQVMVLVKPPNLPTQPGRAIKDSVYHRLKRQYPRETPYLVHRLDKETSGLLLVAKTYSYLRYLQGLWKENKIKKVYLAWIRGEPRWREWTRLRDVFVEERDGRQKEVRAIAFVRSLEVRKGRSLVAVSLVTGRKHQIRRQMATRGMPIIGERRYSHVPCGQGLLLHSCLLAWDTIHLISIPPWFGEYRVDKEIMGHIYPLP